MGRFVKAALGAGIPFGAAMGVWFSLQTNPRWGIPVGSVAGLLFGVGMAAFVEWQRRRGRVFLEGETILRDGPANHFRGAEGVGGWLYLTETRILFRPHRFNFQRADLSLDLVDISAVRTRRTAWIIPNGLEVVAKGRAEHFAVQERDVWAFEIAQGKGAP